MVDVIVKGMFWNAQQKGGKKAVKRGLAIGKASLCLWVRSDHGCDHIDHSIPPSDKGVSGEVFYVLAKRATKNCCVFYKNCCIVDKVNL